MVYVFPLTFIPTFANSQTASGMIPALGAPFKDNAYSAGGPGCKLHPTGSK
jgi:hypothetical protein